MGETAIHIDAPPDKVFAELTKGWEDAEPGPMKIGDHFRIPGKSETFTVMLLERPTRFGISWVDGEVTTIAEYTVLADAGGTQVRLEMEQRSAKLQLTIRIIDALLLGREERKTLEQLKGTVEKAPTK